MYNIHDVLAKKRRNPPLRNYLWYVVLPDLYSEVNSKLNRVPTYGDGVSAALEMHPGDNLEVSSRLANITSPIVNVDTEKEDINNSFWYFAKHNDINTLSFDVYEYEDALSFKYFSAWLQLNINSDGTYNPPYLYKQNLKLCRLDAMHNEIIIHNYSDFFVSGIADITNDHDSNEITKFNITLTGDSISTEITSAATLAEKPEEVEIINGAKHVVKGLPDIKETLANILS